MKKNNIVPTFLRKAKKTARVFKLFINRLAKKDRKTVDSLFKEKDNEVWEEINCLECSNCCRKMTPTFTMADKKRIATHFKMSVKSFEKKWLYKEKKGDWRNVKWPCQFLDKVSNLCTIYEIRPSDCANFPHHHKKNLIDYSPMIKQNVSYCPATNLLIEKMYDALEKKNS